MRRILLAILVILVVAAGAALAWALRYPAIAPIDRPAAAGLDKALVDKGAVLVALGDCAVCHTNPGSEPFGCVDGHVLPVEFEVKQRGLFGQRRVYGLFRSPHRGCDPAVTFSNGYSAAACGVGGDGSPTIVAVATTLWLDQVKAM
ncbi:hypothetical protein BH10PSE9_BH10PSE9_01600 [soil metagenome]